MAFINAVGRCDPACIRAYMARRGCSVVSVFNGYVGVCMAVLVTLVWVGMCIVADSLVKKADNTAKSAQ